MFLLFIKGGFWLFFEVWGYMWDNLLKWVAIYICLLLVVGHTFRITKFWRVWEKAEKGAVCRVKDKVREPTRA